MTSHFLLMEDADHKARINQSDGRFRNRTSEMQRKRKEGNSSFSSGFGFVRLLVQRT